MDDKIIQELSEVIQSSNINFLFGAGASTPYFPLLGNIEDELNKTTDEGQREEQFKKYFTKVMLPNKDIISKDLTSDADFMSTKSSYETFFKSLSAILVRRKSTILSKQANLFTTNIDIMMEKVLEDLKIEYNDGFSGKFIPTFSLANFKKAIYQRSLHFDHISEIPVVNIIKMHGSLTWMHNSTKDKIIFSENLAQLNYDIVSKTGSEFLKEYKKILVVNPEEAKHLESVLNLYYSELLRLYSSELEKENTTLFIVGFSMEDKHLKEITLRSAKSNPTLRIFVCCSQKSKVAMEKKMETNQHPNIQIFTPTNDSEKYTLAYFNENILDKINWQKETEDYV